MDGHSTPSRSYEFQDTRASTFTTTAHVQQSHLLRLATELKFEIIGYLGSKWDLYNLSRTCRILEAAVLFRLYNRMDLEIPEDKSPDRNARGYFTLRPHVVKALRELVVRNGTPTLRGAHQSSRTWASAGSADCHSQRILEQIPKDQLRAFSFLHRTPMTLEMMDLLSIHHGRSLRDLQFFEMQVNSKTGISFPTQLEGVACRSVSDGEAIGRLVQANFSTLKRLHLGQERQLVEQYQRSRTGHLDQTSQTLDSFKSVIKLNQLPQLEELALVGMDITPLIPSPTDGATWRNLSSLTVESCSGSAHFLHMLSYCMHWQSDAGNSIHQHANNPGLGAATTPQPQSQPSQPRLRRFTLRQESLTAALRVGLGVFLQAFSTLEHLALLFENASLIDRPSDFIQKHGPTLRSLVLESRVQPRESLNLDTSRPFGRGGYSYQLWEESVNDIVNLCPDLEELGIGFPWNDEMVRLRKSRLPELRHLRTLHVRNFPESQNLSQLGDYSIKEHARKFVDWVYAHRTLEGLPVPVPTSASAPTDDNARTKKAEAPGLETLSIGPTLYESRWKGANPSRVNPPEFLKTHHFAVDWARTRFGKWSALITGMSQKRMEEMTESKPLKGIFEQVWLR